MLFKTLEISFLVRPPGFEPGSSAREAIIRDSFGFSASFKGYSGDLTPVEAFTVDWDGFREWLLKERRLDTVKGIVSYAERFSDCLLHRNFSKLLTLSQGTRRHVLKALSNLAKFLGMYEEFRRLVSAYGLKWSGRSSDDLLIDRLTRVRDSDEVFEWVRQVKTLRPDLRDFMDLITVTGLRFCEAVESYNLIIKLAGEGKLQHYYNEEKSVLEHFRFKKLFIRKSKKAFMSFVPKEIVEAVSKNKPLASTDAVHSKLRKKKLRFRFSDVREFHASFLTKYLTPPEIDFLHGRVSASVFMRNYFNPAWITDLAQRTLKAIEEILTKIN
jgi:intergrase/recombinase